MGKAYNFVRQHLKREAERRNPKQKFYDLRVRPVRFDVGDWLLYYTPRRYKGRSPKWRNCFAGPFMIQQACGPVIFLDMVQRSARTKPFVPQVDKLRLHYGRVKGDWGKPETAQVIHREEELPTVANRRVVRFDVPLGFSRGPRRDLYVGLTE